MVKIKVQIKLERMYTNFPENTYLIKGNLAMPEGLHCRLYLDRVVKLQTELISPVLAKANLAKHGSLHS